MVSDYEPNLASGKQSDWRCWLQSLDCLESLCAEVLVWLVKGERALVGS